MTLSLWPAVLGFWTSFLPRRAALSHRCFLLAKQHHRLPLLGGDAGSRWARCRGYTGPPRARHLGSAWLPCILEGRTYFLGGQGRGHLYPWRSVHSKMAEGRRLLVGNFPNVQIPRLKCYTLSFSPVDQIKCIYGSLGGGIRLSLNDGLGQPA